MWNLNLTKNNKIEFEALIKQDVNDKTITDFAIIRIEELNGAYGMVKVYATINENLNIQGRYKICKNISEEYSMFLIS